MASTFAIGGELTVHLLGFGAMRLPAAWGEAESPAASREMLREAVRLGALIELTDGDLAARAARLTVSSPRAPPEGCPASAARPR